MKHHPHPETAGNHSETSRDSQSGSAVQQTAPMQRLPRGAAAGRRRPLPPVLPTRPTAQLAAVAIPVSAAEDEAWEVAAYLNGLARAADARGEVRRGA
jgi:hypothetical protein